MIKVLNLYAGLGGNRALWPTNISVTAIELDGNIAQAYGDRFPRDEIIVCDAHKYLLDNFMAFDFIWSSPPCQSHSQYRYNVGVRAKGYKGIYPDMRLYEEVIFLQYHANCKWVVENVVSYYTPLISPQKIARHYFWANFDIPNIHIPAAGIRNLNKISDWEDRLGLLIKGYAIKNKRQVFRNCVDSVLGQHVFNAARKEK